MENKPLDLLLIEDSQDDRVFFQEALNDAGLRVNLFIPRDGAEATQILFGDRSGSAPQFKVIVLDLKMPKLNGLELLRRLKTEELTKRIPVVIFSSSEENRDLTESYRLGANSYLVKPMDLEKFSETVAMLGKYWVEYNKSPVEQDAA